MLSAVKSIAPSGRHEKLTRQAQKLVGQTFYGTLMKQMHNSPFKSKLMDGGRGGEAFQPLMDQHLIDRMSGRLSKPTPAGGTGHKKKGLVQSIVSRYERADATGQPVPGVPPVGRTGRESNGSNFQGGSMNQPPARQSPLPSGSRGQALEETRSHVAAGLRA